MICFGSYYFPNCRIFFCSVIMGSWYGDVVLSITPNLGDSEEIGHDANDNSLKPHLLRLFSSVRGSLNTLVHQRYSLGQPLHRR